MFDTTIVNTYIHTGTEFDDCKDDVLSFIVIIGWIYGYVLSQKLYAMGLLLLCSFRTVLCFLANCT
jgi:hypothetical protein